MMLLPNLLCALNKTGKQLLEQGLDDEARTPRHVRGTEAGRPLVEQGCETRWSLVRLLEATPVSPNQNMLLTCAHVAALYPSLKLDAGAHALRRFLTRHTSMPLQLQPKYLELARLAFKTTMSHATGYKELLTGYKELRARTGNALGTSFLVGGGGGGGWRKVEKPSEKKNCLV